MCEQFRGQHASSIVEDALGLAELGLDVIQRLEEGRAVDDIHSVCLDLDTGADGFLDSLLLELQLLFPPCDEGNIVVALRGKERRH